MNNSTAYQNIWYQGHDGLKLYARDYAYQGIQSEPKGTILCLHGLSRNSADFDYLCQHLAKDYRVIAADQRGRGLSEYDSHFENYNLPIYLQDMLTLLSTLNLSQVILIGTSMGGLMSMLLALMAPEKVLALVLNDVGPELNPAGLERIKGYVGKQKPVTNWDQAIAQVREINAEVFPDLDDEGWRNIARAIFHENDKGQPVLAFDPAIAQSITESETSSPPENLWTQFKAITNTPLLLLRGESSDILSVECVGKMKTINPAMDYCEVANRGHAPLLNETDSVAAIDTFLEKIS